MRLEDSTTTRSGNIFILMAGMAARRGWQRRGGRIVTWFVLRHA